MAADDERSSAHLRYIDVPRGAAAQLAEENEAVSVRAVKEKAAKLVASGQFERAEVLLRQALTQSPRDVATWLRHAEVLKRLARNGDAVASYRLAARILDEEGHHPRAVAALKLALSLMPDDVDLIADIIRSEMRARREGNDLRALFPLSSASQLLATAASSTESGLYQNTTAVLDVEQAQLALPMASETAADTSSPTGTDGASALPQPSAPSASQESSPRPSAPFAPAAVGLPLTRPSAPLASQASDSSPRPSAPNTLPRSVDASPSPTSSAPCMAAGSEPSPLTSPTPSAPIASAVESSADPGPARPSSPRPSPSDPTTPFGTPVDPLVDSAMGASAPPGPLGEPPALASEATDGLQYELGVSTPWPHVRRLSDRRIAVQTTEGGRWLVLEAAAPINVRFIEELEVPDDAEWLD